MTYQIRPSSADGWLAFAAGPRLLVVPAGDDAFIPSAWRVLAGADGFQAALDLLTSGGLAATPAFVLLEWSEGTDARLIVRGDAVVTVTDSSGDTAVTATDVSTWVERTMPATRVAVAVPSATAQGTAVLPLERGVALAAEIAVGAPAPSEVSTAESESVPTKRAPAAAESARPTPESARPTPTPAPAPTGADTEVTVVVPDFDNMRKTGPVDAEELPSEPDSGYDYLFGETMYRSVADAAVRAPGEDAEAGASDAAGDHDGHTVLTSDIGKLRASRKRSPKADTAPPPAARQLVLVLSTTGAREPLTQPVLVGRSPSVSKLSGGQIPRLVTVGSAEQDISRNHVQFVVEGGTVVVTDLHSKNGTAIVLPGKDSQKLRPGEPTSVIPGTVVDLGGGVTFTVDED